MIVEIGESQPRGPRTPWDPWRSVTVSTRFLKILEWHNMNITLYKLGFRTLFLNIMLTNQV